MHFFLSVSRQKSSREGFSVRLVFEAGCERVVADRGRVAVEAGLDLVAGWRGCHHCILISLKGYVLTGVSIYILLKAVAKAEAAAGLPAAKLAVNIRCEVRGRSDFDDGDEAAGLAERELALGLAKVHDLVLGKQGRLALARVTPLLVIIRRSSVVHHRAHL